MARALGYDSPRHAVRMHCRWGITYTLTDSLDRPRETKVIPKGDIYRLIVKAADQGKNEEIREKAAAFESWIFDEVLPSIDNHGLYATPAAVEKMLDDPDFAIMLLNNYDN